jgi:hypothetical protein
VREIPYARKIVNDYLRNLGHRAVTRFPSRNTATPWVQTTQLNAGDSPRSGLDHNIRFLLQFDCYAGSEGGNPEADRLGDAVRADLKSLEGEVEAGAVITEVSFVNHATIPDPDLRDREGVGRARSILTAAIRMHNAPEGS